jgi:uncharacterized protein (DUF302 family)
MNEYRQHVSAASARAMAARPPPTASNDSFHCVIQDLSFGNAIARVTEALGTEGFEVLTVIDVQATMKATLGVDLRPWRILGACHPALAHRALCSAPEMGLLLPCNVVVREEAGGRLMVGFMDPVAVLQLTHHPEVGRVAHAVRRKFERVRAILASQHPRPVPGSRRSVGSATLIPG